jgi:hypothetical protein
MLLKPSEMMPTDQCQTFFLWLKRRTAGQSENKERVQTFVELQNEWDRLALSERVSEVNLLDVRDVRAQLAGDDSQIEIRLGAQDHGQRLKKALGVLDSQRQTARGPLISYIDLSARKARDCGPSFLARMSVIRVNQVLRQPNLLASARRPTSQRKRTQRMQKAVAR